MISATLENWVARPDATCDARYKTTSTRIVDSEQSHVGWIIRGYMLSATTSYLENSGEIAFLRSWSGWQKDRRSLDLQSPVAIPLQASYELLFDKVLQVGVVYSDGSFCGPIMKCVLN